MLCKKVVATKISKWQGFSFGMQGDSIQKKTEPVPLEYWVWLMSYSNGQNV
jgi:hypothetical protein